MTISDCTDRALRTLRLQHEGVRKKLLVARGMRRSELIDAVGKLYSVSKNTLSFEHGGEPAALRSDLPDGFEVDVTAVTAVTPPSAVLDLTGPPSSESCVAMVACRCESPILVYFEADLRF